MLTLFLRACPYDTVQQKFRFLFKKGSSKKNFYERHDYKSVDEKSLSYAMSRETMKKRIQDKKG